MRFGRAAAALLTATTTTIATAIIAVTASILLNAATTNVAAVISSTLTITTIFMILLITIADADPLLPRVVAFIQEFPEFLQTIVHCARKTEVALWPYLFSTVGNPKDLFEMCLLNKDLETAATYLIILQNLEKPIVSRQLATILLDSALDRGTWELCRDLVRFLKAIDSSEQGESPPVMVAPSRMSGSSAYPAFPASPPLSPTGSDYSYSNVSNVGRLRTSSIVEPRDVKLTMPGPQKEKIRHTMSDSVVGGSKKAASKGKPGEPTAEQVYIDMILCRHARKLLASNQIRTLGYFAANMEDFHFVAWLKRERVRAGKVDDFVEAIQSVHNQFEWPMPALTASVLHQLKKSAAAASLSSLSSNAMDNDLLGSAAGDKEDGNLVQPLTPVNVSKVGEVRGRTLPHQLSEQTLSQMGSDEVLLRPQYFKTDEISLATIETSDTNSLLGDYEVVNDSVMTGNGETLSPDIEGMSQEVAVSRGPEQAHLELEYLLHIMLEASCLEWALILAVVLRDSLAVVRVVNTASLTDTPLDMIGRMREGLSFLELWADTECLGYKPFLHRIRGEIHMLSKLVETSTSSAPSLSLDVSAAQNSSLEGTVAATLPRNSSQDESNLSPSIQAIRSDLDGLGIDETQDEELGQANKPSDCAVS
ncbi:Rab6a-gef complex partner protein 1-like [Plakobranchus ocellatus]|uniref:Protein RIC1 homolog n=1 Tax=Plakobranchus ocellatus TaxID=259542 RepID=A0AAV4A4U7_9GAST|nr:Rab6a-gef complex partner protein 1-like [Plakobranchus ocellatus]